jgi:hypothetical protein
MGLVGLKIKDDIAHGSSATGPSMGLDGLKSKTILPMVLLLVVLLWD